MNISRLFITALVLIFMTGPTFAGKKKNKEHKTTLCHNGKAISVSQSSVGAHYKHGDTKGKCPTITAVVMMRCLNNEGMLEVSGLSSSSDEAYIQPVVDDKLSCAEEVAHAINSGFKLRNVHTGLIDGETEYLFVKTILKPKDY